MIYYLKSLLLCALISFTYLVSAQSYYVSPNGKGSGTMSSPFGIEQAIQKANQNLSKSGTKTELILSDGDYHLTQPIVISSDNQSKNSTLIIRSEKPRAATIKGSKVLKNLSWKPYKDGIMMTPLSEKLDFEELFVSGKQQVLARYPNYDASAFLGGTAQNDILKDTKKIDSWANPKGGYLHALHNKKWGGVSFTFLGKKGSELILSEGQQNNRGFLMLGRSQYVENIFEELDNPGEWFLDKDKNILYYYPNSDVDLNSATFEAVLLENLITLKGTEKNPLTNVKIDGLVFSHAKRTFEKCLEKLIRTDWMIYRMGAVLFQGTKDCSFLNSDITLIGGNAFFANHYNENTIVSGNHIYNIGGSSVNLVGDIDAVRSPSFGYENYVKLEDMDKTPGPKTNNYPQKCLIDNNLIHDIGKVEKQIAGVNVTVAHSITISNNSIYKVPRAGINVGEGTWGGHIIEKNDVFKTVQETGDHGSFNSWGRQRFWSSNRGSTAKKRSELGDDVFKLDILGTTMIRNNRMRCDHGWDIDLDDGSSYYEVYNNLCLNGGIKLREGFNRKAYNNITINGTLDPHVWYPKSEGYVYNNIFMRKYTATYTNLSARKKQFDKNIFTNSFARDYYADRTGVDQNSVVEEVQFVDPANGDFTVKPGSKAFELGFKNFPMDQFGVKIERLKKLAEIPEFPKIDYVGKVKGYTTEITFLDGKAKSIIGNEASAYGTEFGRGGIAITSCKEGSKLYNLGFREADAILEVNGNKVKTTYDINSRKFFKKGDTQKVLISRNQKEQTITFTP